MSITTSPQPTLSRRQNKSELSLPKKQTRIRLVNSINDAVRTAIRGRGDLSTQVEEAISKVNLTKVKLIDFKAEGGTADDTTVSLDPQLYDKWFRASRKRGSSMNVLVNSALAATLQIDVRFLEDIPKRTLEEVFAK